MIDLSMNFERMKKEIEFTHYKIDEVISPVKSPEKSAPQMGINYLPSDLYVKNLTEIILGNVYDYNWGIYNAVEDILFNAFERGNKYDINLDIFVKIAKGKKGVVLNVADCGEGFDLNKKLKLMNENKKYFYRQGRGLKIFSEINEKVCFEGRNNIVSLMYKSEKK